MIKQTHIVQVSDCSRICGQCLVDETDLYIERTCYQLDDSRRRLGSSTCKWAAIHYYVDEI